MLFTKKFVDQLKTILVFNNIERYFFYINHSDHFFQTNVKSCSLFLNIRWNFFIAVITSGYTVYCSAIRAALKQLQN